MPLRSIFRLLALAGTIAAAVLFALYADDNLGNISDLGWGFFCLAVGIAAYFLEGAPYIPVE